MESLDYVILAAYFIALLYVGYTANKKQVDVEDYYVGGRGVGTLPIAALWMSSWVGGAAIMGTAEKSFTMGVSTLWYSLSIFCGFIFFALTCAERIKLLGDKHKLLTYSDLIEQRYDAKTRIVSTVTTILAYIGYIASQLLGAAHIITSITGVTLGMAFCIATSITIAYTAFGGFFAVEKTDRFQALLVILGITLVGVPLTWNHVGGTSVLLAELPTEYFQWGTWGWGTIIALFISMVLTFFTSMDSYTRCYAAKSPRSARNGTLYASILALFVSVSICFLGMSARVLFPELENGSSALVSLIMLVFPVGVKGLMLVAILSAIMSTADTCILCASANLNRDIYQRFIDPSASKAKVLRLGIISSFIVGILGAGIGWYSKDIIGILVMAFTINSAGLFVPTIAALFWKKATAKAALWSMTLSLSVVLFWYAGQAFYADGSLFALDPVWPGLIVSIGVFVPMSLATSEETTLGTAYEGTIKEVETPS